MGPIKEFKELPSPSGSTN
jgi:ribosomal protein S18